MGSVTLSIQYAKNTGLVFSPSELRTLYFTGIKLQDQDGNPIPEETINFYIDAAQIEIANTLSIKLIREAYRETRDFVFDDYISWGYFPCNYPAVKGYDIKGFMNSVLQIQYPPEWLVTKTQSPDQDLYYRSINLVPLSGPASAVSSNAIFVGIMPYIGYFGNKNIPSYWSAVYLTGFLKIPADILNAIGKTAAINILMMLSDLLSGQPGVNSKSIGLDGLSQSSSLQGFWKRIEAYRKELDRSIPLLKSRYNSITIGAL